MSLKTPEPIHAKCLQVPDKITLVKLPPYSPELNPMENVWAYLRANKLAITVSTPMTKYSTNVHKLGTSLRTTQSE
ncbi:transposase [Octadecabacter arcticus]|uniref:transposase n=1 Tax=Octadecabacter arcticus TaxID=53946 RepID=UPI00165128A1